MHKMKSDRTWAKLNTPKYLIRLCSVEGLIFLISLFSDQLVCALKTGWNIMIDSWSRPVIGWVGVWVENGFQSSTAYFWADSGSRWCHRCKLAAPFFFVTISIQRQRAEPRQPSLFISVASHVKFFSEVWWQSALGKPWPILFHQGSVNPRKSDIFSFKCCTQTRLVTREMKTVLI